MYEKIIPCVAIITELPGLENALRSSPFPSMQHTSSSRAVDKEPDFSKVIDNKFECMCQLARALQY